MGQPKICRTLWFLAGNIPLGHCRKPEYSEEAILGTKKREMSWAPSKEVGEAARIIVTALGNPGVPELIASEWELLGPGLRMRITDRCNEERNSRSGNCSKGIFRLDKLLGGRILTRKDRETERVLLERDGKTAAGTRKLPPSRLLFAQPT